MTTQQLQRLTKAQLIERLSAKQKTEEEIRTKLILTAVAATLFGLAL